MTGSGRGGSERRPGGFDSLRRQATGTRFRLVGAHFRAFGTPSGAVGREDGASRLPAAGTFTGVAWAGSGFAADHKTKRMP